MKPLTVGRPVVVFGLLGGVLTVILKSVEYRYLVVELSVEVYSALVAGLFVSLGLWLGLTLTRAPAENVETVVVQEVIRTVATPFERNAERLAALGITPRELEILELIASGLSTREIAERIYVSQNTVKTHSSRLFEKLNARRRTQAVQIGKELGILP